MNAYEKRRLAHSAAAVIGIDAGKRRHAMVVRPASGEDSEPYLFDATRTGFGLALLEIRRVVPDAQPRDMLVAIEFAGYYGFTLAHWLRDQGFRVVSVLPKHTKHWKEVYHNQRLKSDPADAQTITDLAAQGSFVGFPFLKQVYADLRYLVSHRERLQTLRTGSIARLKDVLQVVWPEFESLCGNFNKKTPIALLRTYPSPQAFLAAPRASVVKLIRRTSRGQLGEALYDDLRTTALQTTALPGAHGFLAGEVPLQLEMIALVERQIAKVEGRMIECLKGAPEAQALLSIPKLGAPTAAVFLGSIGDPRMYESSRQALRLAGLSLITSTASGMKPGQPRISKRGRSELRKLMYMFAVRSVTNERHLPRGTGSRVESEPENAEEEGHHCSCS